MSKKPFFLHPPEENGPLSGGLVILWHGAGGDVDQAHLASTAGLVASLGGFAVRARFPYRIAGKKPPDRMPKLVAAMKEMIPKIRAKTLEKPRFSVLGGRSMGGRAASMLCSEGERMEGLLFLSYPLHPAGKPEKLRDEHLYALKVPMLFIQGEKDALCKPPLLLPVTKRIGKRATVSMFPKADHSFRNVASGDVDRVTEKWLLARFG